MRGTEGENRSKLTHHDTDGESSKYRERYLSQNLDFIWQTIADSAYLYGQANVSTKPLETKTLDVVLVAVN